MNTHSTREFDDLENRTVRAGSLDPDERVLNYQYEDLMAWHHHQLQKARHDWLREEIVRLVEVPHKGHVNYHRTNGYNQAIRDIRDRYQAELDQDKK